LCLPPFPKSPFLMGLSSPCWFCLCYVFVVCFCPTSIRCPWPHPRAVHSCRWLESPPAVFQPWSCRPGSVCYDFCPGSLHYSSVRFSVACMHSVILSQLVCRVRVLFCLPPVSSPGTHVWICCAFCVGLRDMERSGGTTFLKKNLI